MRCSSSESGITPTPYSLDTGWDRSSPSSHRASGPTTRRATQGDTRTTVSPPALVQLPIRRLARRLARLLARSPGLLPAPHHLDPAVERDETGRTDRVGPVPTPDVVDRPARVIPRGVG